MSQFTNKIVVITGGNSGIGLAAAQEFERKGARVVVTGRNADTLAAAARALGEEAITLKADVTKAADLDQLLGTYWHLSAYAQSDVRNVLALTL